MRRRLSPERRREEILDVARRVIDEEGFAALTLRGIARRCDMSAPGLMHHFPTLEDLLEAVLERRDTEDVLFLKAQLGPDTGLLELIDQAMRYYDERIDEAHRFDALELEALDPSHPAHDYFERRRGQVLERLRPVVEQEFDDPEAVMALLRAVMVGMRVAPPTGSGLASGWAPIRRALASLPRKQGPTSGGNGAG